MSVASDMVTAYRNAELAVLDGKTFRLGERQLTMEDLGAIRAGRHEWEQRLADEQAKAAGKSPGLFARADFRSCE